MTENSNKKSLLYTMATTLVTSVDTPGLLPSSTAISNKIHEVPITPVSGVPEGVVNIVGYTLDNFKTLYPEGYTLVISPREINGWVNVFSKYFENRH